MHTTTTDQEKALAHYSAMAVAAQALKQAATLAEHTPGPWKWSGGRLVPLAPEPEQFHVHTILEREGGSGFLCSDWRLTQAELDADYRVIEAAPVMLEALRQCYAELLRHAPEAAGPFGAITAARDAIVDATGVHP
jgi:hypothetical protein